MRYRNLPEPFRQSQKFGSSAWRAFRHFATISPPGILVPRKRKGRREAVGSNSKADQTVKKCTRPAIANWVPAASRCCS